MSSKIVEEREKERKDKNRLYKGHSARLGFKLRVWAVLCYPTLSIKPSLQKYIFCFAKPLN